jgi:uncharacterized cofD-like protein
MRIVAFGGGHGLGASLRALKRVPGVDLTAVVTVGDDGGSSGRLRAERGVLPPGDLRQALAALSGPDPRSVRTATLFQHRFDGDDPLGGHPVGNLVLCGLMELYPDPVLALGYAAELLQASGRVLPMSRVPIGIEADVLDEDGKVEVLRGQHAVAVTHRHVEEVRILPADPPACVEAVAAIGTADWLIFGPGSWYTSVIPHLMVPDLGRAILASPARRLVILNLAAEKETASLTVPDHVHALTRYLPGLRADVVLADAKAVGDPGPVRHAAESLGARLVLAPVAVPDDGPRHDPAALAAALAPILG